MELDLTGNAVIVTGTAHGIGHATAELLIAEGANVVGVDLDEQDNSHGDAFAPLTLDITAPGAPERIVAAALERYGRIDGLVNNVGATKLYAGFLDIPEEAWLASLDVNFHAARRLTAAVLPKMVTAGIGSLVHVSTDAVRYPGPQEMHYSVGKSALLNFSKALAMEFGPAGIRSNIVTPGPTRTWMYDKPGGWAEQAGAALGMDKDAAVEFVFTQMRPLMTGHMGTAEDAARVIVQLLSPRSGQVIGAEWTVDGGSQRQI